MSKKQSIITLLIFIFTFLFSACQEEPAVATVVVREVIEVAETPQIVTRIIEQPIVPTPDGGAESLIPPTVLDIGLIGSTLPLLDPQVAQSRAIIDLIENLYVGLTRFDPFTQQVEPSLAENWTVSADGRVWTFNLRDDLFWIRPLNQEENGKWSVTQLAPVNADDVVFTLQRACQNETNTPDVVTLFIIQGCETVYAINDPTEADLQQVAAVALDEKTVQFTLTRPSSYFLTITSLWYLRPIPKVVVEEFPDTWLDAENFVTSGPFFPIPRRQSFQFNPDWPHAVMGNIDFINYRFVEDTEEAITLWQAKQIDFVPSVLDSGNALDDLEEKIFKEPEQTVFYLGFNFDSGVFREPEVRRAFSAAIDREVLVETIYNNQAYPLTHLVPPGVVGALPIGEIGMGYDPDYARIQIAESGFGSCRAMPPIRFLVNSSDLSLRQAEAIREMWIEELGCSEEQIVVEQAQFGTLLANTRKDAGGFRPDVWELGWASFYPDAHSWHGELLQCNESENRANRPCMDVDQLIEEASRVVDMPTRLQLYRQIEIDLFSRGGIAPVVPLYATSQDYLVQDWLTFRQMNFGGQQYDRFVIDEMVKRLERSRGE